MSAGESRILDSEPRVRERRVAWLRDEENPVAASPRRGPVSRYGRRSAAVSQRRVVTAATDARQSFACTYTIFPIF